MILVTTDYISGKECSVLGMVEGSTIQTVHAGKDLMNSFKTLIGGELKSYTEMMENARALAVERMVQQASELGADGIVGIRFATSSIMQAASEVMVYGTAVRFI